MQVGTPCVMIMFASSNEMPFQVVQRDLEQARLLRSRDPNKPLSSSIHYCLELEAVPLSAGIPREDQVILGRH